MLGASSSEEEDDEYLNDNDENAEVGHEIFYDI